MSIYILISIIQLSYFDMLIDRCSVMLYCCEVKLFIYLYSERCMSQLLSQNDQILKLKSINDTS